MNKKYAVIGSNAFLISVIGVFGVDYFSHLLFSNPMETGPYFFAKFCLFFAFSVVFLSIFDMHRTSFWKIVGAGIIVSSLWGMYYNVFPAVFGYYPFGISLRGLSFLGMGFLGTGLAFGVVHTTAFVAGYYITVYLYKKIQ